MIEQREELEGVRVRVLYNEVGKCKGGDLGPAVAPLSG